MVKVMMMVMVQEIAEYLQQIYLEDGLSSERLDSEASLRRKDERTQLLLMTLIVAMVTKNAPATWNQEMQHLREVIIVQSCSWIVLRLYDDNEDNEDKDVNTHKPINNSPKLMMAMMMIINQSTTR